MYMAFFFICACMQGLGSVMNSSLSKYERVQVLAIRVRQLNANAPAMVEWKEGDSVYEIAKRELATGRLPIRIHRNPQSSSSSSSSASSSASSSSSSSACAT